MPNLIKLSYTNPNNHEVFECPIPEEWLAIPTDISQAISLSDDIQVIIFKRDNQLTIACRTETEAAADVDVTILAALPIAGLHVYTKGTCTINVPLDLPAGIHLYADNLTIEHALKSATFITLATPRTNNNSVTIKQPLTTSKLTVSSPSLNVRAAVTAGCATFHDCQLNMHADGNLTIRGETESNLFLKGLTNAGELNLANTQIKTESLAKFEDGCKAQLVDCQLFLQSLEIKPGANIKGRNGYIQVDDLMWVDGTVKIAGLTIVPHVAVIHGLVTGEEKLRVQVARSLCVTGALGSDDTNVRANFLNVYAHANRANFDFGPYTQGTLAGERSLEINTLVSSIVAGGTLQGSNIQQRTGLSFNLLGMVFAFDYINLPLVDLPFGLDLPYSPANNADLLNPDKVLRLSLRMAANCFAKLRAVLSLVSFVRPFASATLKASAAVTRAAYHDLFTSNSNESEVVGLITHAKQKISETAGTAYNGLSRLRDPNSIREMYQSTSWLDLVNSLLTAKGYYILGSTIYHIGTNTRAFANEATTTLMQSPRAIAAEFSDAIHLPGQLQDAISKIQKFPTSVEQATIRGVKELSFRPASIVPVKDPNGVTSSTAVAQISALEPPTEVPEIQQAPSVTVTTPAPQTSTGLRIKLSSGRSKDRDTRFRVTRGKPKPPPAETVTLGSYNNPGNLGIYNNQYNFNQVLVQPPIHNPIHSAHLFLQLFLQFQQTYLQHPL